MFRKIFSKNHYYIQRLRDEEAEIWFGLSRCTEAALTLRWIAGLPHPKMYGIISFL